MLKIYIDNPFPILVVSHERAIRCLDLSPSRNRLALVDQVSKLNPELNPELNPGLSDRVGGDQLAGVTAGCVLNSTLD